MKKRSWGMMGVLLVLCVGLMGFVGSCDLQSRCLEFCGMLPIDLCGICEFLPGG